MHIDALNTLNTPQIKDANFAFVMSAYWRVCRYGTAPAFDSFRPQWVNCSHSSLGPDRPL